MHIRDAAQDEEGGPINLTSMMDMVFNLLIFFLVATTIVQEEQDLAVKLPNTSQAAPRDPSNPPRQLVINIRDDGLLMVAGKSYDAAGLSRMLSEVAKEQPARNVLIRADERSTFKHFATVVDLCRHVGIAEARIGYLRPDQPAAP